MPHRRDGDRRLSSLGRYEPGDHGLSLKVVKKLKGSPCFPQGFVIFWYALFLLFPATFGDMQAYEDFLLNAYFWLLLGVLFRLPTIALSAQLAANAPTAQPRPRWVR
jgi:hypothetical protein